MTRPLDAGLQVCRRRLDAAAAGPLAVAFSGGGDSLALLLVAGAYARQCGRPLLALHVDHGLQACSRAWAEQAAAAAERLGAPFRVLRWEGDKPATGVPAAARAARHGLIAEAAREAGARVVLLGHTLDDQLENALMRGAGAPVGPLAEWSASPVWPQGRGLFHCRPLLAVRRAALRDWLAQQGLDWIEDPANADPRYARARARAALDQGSFARAIAPAADIAALAGACRVTPWGAIEIDRTALRVAPQAEGLRLLQIALACASGAERLARPARASALLERLQGRDAFTAALAGARVMAADAVRLVREAGEAARGGLAPLDLSPGAAAVWDGRWALTAGTPGWRVQALGGLARRLEARDTAALRAMPASDRPSLPVLRNAEGHVRLVRLATAGQGDHIDEAVGCVRMLVDHRFKAACGLFRREDDIGTFVRMANVHPPSYVEAEVKG
ncbi:MAG: tilS [Caulobacteraceae bacterium]|nr:tilS [Caulobacteraceae bacterium]